MLERDIHLFTVRGIPVGLNWSWLLVFLLVFWSLAAALFPADYPDRSTTTYIAMALVATVLFFGSILFHELSHALQALREGAHVREITLWLFGGVSRVDEPLPTPGAEFRVVAAGPAASAVAAAAFYVASLASEALGMPATAVGVFSYLARINLLLLAFNVVPALPLDGGRLLHAALWRRYDDRAEATLSAASAGRAFAFLLIGIGMLGLLGGGGLGGIWFVVLGWFLLQAVGQEAMSARIERAIAGLRVRDLMAPNPVAVEPALPVGDLMAVMRRSPHVAYPVVDDGHLVGMVTRRALGEFPAARREQAHVRDLMLIGDDVPVAHPDDSALKVLTDLQREPGRAVVVDGASGDAVVGVLSATDYHDALVVAPSSAPGAGDPRRRRRRRRPSAFGIWLIVGLLFAIAGAALYNPPYVVVEPGETFDVRDDITITGVDVQEPTGAYLLTSVRLRQPSALGLLLGIARGREVVAIADLAPSRTPADEIARLQRAMYTDSQQMAAAAAATLAGYDVELTGTGAEVVAVIESAPAADTIRPGDVIVGIGGDPIATTTDLRDALAGLPAGQLVDITFERSGLTQREAIELIELPDVAHATGLGVLVTTRDLTVDVPFEIEFRERPEVGGPSAGLVFALAISDMLDASDDAAGRTIAATGTIAADGAVGSVGGVDEKADAARDGGAELFLVPEPDVTSIDAGNGDGDGDDDLEVRGVDDLAGALETLATRP